VDHEQVDRRVPTPLADAECRTVEARGACLEGGEAGRDAEPAITMPVPVDADIDAELGNHRLHEPHHRHRAVGGRMPDGVRYTQTLRPGTNRRAEQPP